MPTRHRTLPFCVNPFSVNLTLSTIKQLVLYLITYAQRRIIVKGINTK